MDDRTLVVNKILGLIVAGEGEWPQTLLKHGHGAHAIEESIAVGQRTATPDVVALNRNTGHMLVVDCKGGANIDSDQDLRYAHMGLKDIVDATRPPCHVRAHALAHATSEGHEERIRAHTAFPLIVFGNGSVRGIGDLGHAELTRELLEGVPLCGLASPDTDVYPFSIHDTNDHIDRQVVAGLVAYMVNHPWMAHEHLLNLETANHVLRASHPLHSSLSRGHRLALANAIKRSLVRLDQSGELGRTLDML